MDSKFLLGEGLTFASRKVSLLAENSTFVKNLNSCRKISTPMENVYSQEKSPHLSKSLSDTWISFINVEKCKFSCELYLKNKKCFLLPYLLLER